MKKWIIMNVSKKRFTISESVGQDSIEVQVLKLDNVSEISYVVTEGELTRDTIIIKMDNGRSIDTEIPYPYEAGVSEAYDNVREDFIRRIEKA